MVFYTSTSKISSESYILSFSYTWYIKIHVESGAPFYYLKISYFDH